VKGSPEEAEEFFKDTREIKELLLFALQMEKASQTFYLQSAQKVEEKGVKDLLEKLSRVEERHAEHLHTKLKDIWPEAPPLRALKESEFMEGALSLSQSILTIQEKPPQEKIEVLEIALEKECKAFDLYQQMADKIVSPLRGLFRDLAKQERGHIDELSMFL
jgi:rubrerythrin